MNKNRRVERGIPQSTYERPEPQAGLCLRAGSWPCAGTRPGRQEGSVRVLRGGWRCWSVVEAVAPRVGAGEDVEVGARQDRLADSVWPVTGRKAETRSDSAQRLHVTAMLVGW
jgi:hypothetical protein